MPEGGGQHQIPGHLPPRCWERECPLPFQHTMVDFEHYGHATKYHRTLEVPEMFDIFDEVQVIEFAGG